MIQTINFLEVFPTEFKQCEQQVMLEAVINEVESIFIKNIGVIESAIGNIIEETKMIRLGNS
jgi:hypothetical protein